MPTTVPSPEPHEAPSRRTEEPIAAAASANTHPAPQRAPVEAVAADGVDGADELEELLIEEISIDGMCGVY